MDTLEQLIWNRDHSDALHEWDRYESVAEMLASGLINDAEARQIAGLVS